MGYAHQGTVDLDDPANEPTIKWIGRHVVSDTYYIKAGDNYFVLAEKKHWPKTEGERFGPASQDGWKITSLEMTDLNLDGNYDVLYAPECTQASCTGEEKQCAARPSKPARSRVFAAPGPVAPNLPDARLFCLVAGRTWRWASRSARWPSTSAPSSSSNWNSSTVTTRQRRKLLLQWS